MIKGEKQKIGDWQCPVCAKPVDVKLNKNLCGYFHCTGCFNGVFSKLKTQEYFLTKQPDFSEPENDSTITETDSPASTSEPSVEHATARQGNGKPERIKTAFD